MRILALISLSLLSILGASARQDISSLISKDVFEKMLKHRNNAACEGKGFYTYEAFITAAKAFHGFGTTGDDTTKKREIAAFLAQTSHETTGGGPMSQDGPYAWGYCFVTEQKKPHPVYCDGNPQQQQQYPCAAGKNHYNYGPAGMVVKHNLLANPDLVATDPIISFKTAFWFWMTPQPPKPSSHDVITGRWTPSPADSAAGRVPGVWKTCKLNLMKALGSDLLADLDLVAADATISFRATLWFWMTPQSPKPSWHDVITGQWTPSATDSAAGHILGYGVITNKINGGFECGQGYSTAQQVSRIGFLMHFSDIMGVGYGDNPDYNHQRPFG
ncbi:hypothetical protein RHSIM_Rhsim10G0202700 [Rhododendron simsii]|uniref:Glycoside hydrolase family 19 catalytic domain-containing protein n=1 Tax=Rhododendron simsii TaxID=118357 RepID=A0A834GAD4_RHOSS|nr:hypothetical protein RHSIM_Rhsim10G0202700 [Rhododendron simsii]